MAMKANTYLIITRCLHSRSRSGCKTNRGTTDVDRAIWEKSCATTARKIYNVLAKTKKNMMQERNKVEEIPCLSAQRGYTVFYRNRMRRDLTMAGSSDKLSSFNPISLEFLPK
ncbi:hypothetical protein M9H77_23465 [Catharanthus roseus]|uniref:Uncharacterized protein n=1 Tax=Catharanthus roseus TaxID=4058 RepID=A0ACC0AVW1_CATRO|nr:hypothetical protein M9H77_23465 [Catharanthus roseus]